MRLNYKTSIRGRERVVKGYNHSQMNRIFINIKMKTGKIVREKKVQGLFNFFIKNPQQLVEWLIFGRSPYTEISLQNYWKVGRRFVINLLTSTRMQTDSFWRKNNKSEFNKYQLDFFGFLPKVSQKEVIEAIEDALFYYNHEFAQLPQLTENQRSFHNKLRLLEKKKQLVAPYITSWINSSQKSRWKSLKDVTQEIAFSLGKKRRKLFSATRLIVVFTLFDHFMQSVPQLIVST